jgi:hypothetical protein
MPATLNCCHRVGHKRVAEGLPTTYNPSTSKEGWVMLTTLETRSDSQALCDCLRQTYRDLSFVSLPHVADALAAFDNRVDVDRAIAYLRQQSIGIENLEIISEAAAHLIKSRWKEIERLYLSRDKKRQIDEIFNIVRQKISSPQSDYTAESHENYEDALRVIGTNTEIPPHAEGCNKINWRAQNYERVDFVSSAEVVMEKTQAGAEWPVYAQIDFIRHLYLEREKVRIEFGIRRAFLTVDIAEGGSGSLKQADALRARPNHGDAYFVRMQDAPKAVAVCMDSDHGTSLGEMALPPTGKENYLCQIASATPDAIAAGIRAELRVSLDLEGFHLPGTSPSRKAQIKAIVGIAAKKNHHLWDGREIRRPVTVMERDRGN